MSSSSSLDAVMVDLELLHVSSHSFGEYDVPYQRVCSMTSLRIIHAVARLSGSASSHEHMAAGARVVRLEAELDNALRSLSCGERLRADLPVLHHNQLASLLVKCWTYLVWMHWLELEPAALTRPARDQLLWSLMRPFETGHSTQAELKHVNNRHAKTNIKQGLKLTALLLCHEPLLVQLVALGNVSADALVSLTQRQLNLDTLQLVLERADHTAHRITKHNIRALLQPPGTASTARLSPKHVDKARDGSTAPPPTAAMSPVSAQQAAHELLTLTRSSLSAASSPPLLPPPSWVDTTPADMPSTHGQRVRTRQSMAHRVDDEHSEEMKQVEDEKGSAEDEEEAENDNAEGEHGDGDDEDEQEDVCEEDEDESTTNHGIPLQTAPKRRGRGRSRKRSRRHPAPAAEDTSRHVPPTAREPQPSVSAPPPQQPAQAPTRPPSAADRLRSATFRAPDDLRGCVHDDAVHDLFCRHHVAWRRRALEELAVLSPSQLAAIREQHQHSSTMRMDVLYLGLAERWGHRIQFVAPLHTDKDVTLEQALAHISLEPQAHDSDGLFYARDSLHSALRYRTTASTSPPASEHEYEFKDAEAALCSAHPRKYWTFACNSARDEAGGNSSHMLALYRVFTACEQASFDGHSGVDAQLPLGLLLRFGCMLVVVVQTEGSVVYVPSAEANESAHLVTTASDRAAISVAGNVLNPRHLARIVRQHGHDGPSEAARLEWARDFCQTAPQVASADTYQVAPGGSLLQVPTPEAIHDMHTFLCGVQADDARYQPEYYRQSWIPDLFSTSQACRILSEALDHEALPSAMVVEQLLDAAGRGCTAETRSVLAALSIKAASAAMTKPLAPWHTCDKRFGCPGHRAPVGAVQRVHSISRPPLLLTVAADTTLAQQALTRHVHEGITKGVVVCNSFVRTNEACHPPPRKRGSTRQSGQHSTGANADYDFRRAFGSQADSGDSLTASWMKESLRERGVVYLTDIIADQQDDDEPAPSQWYDAAEEMVRQLVGERTARGFLLRHCSHQSPGVHSPSFFALFTPHGGHISSPHHNESHRVAAWHLLLQHPTFDSNKRDEPQHASSTSRLVPASSQVPSATSPPAATISIIHQAMTAKSKLIAGSDHLLDGVDPEDGARRQSSVRERYASSVSLAFGELTEESSWKVMAALAMTPSSRLLDVGSAFGRFCVHAALAAPRGATVTGIEVGIKRAQLASQYLDELTVEHGLVMAPIRPHIKLIQGDIVEHLAELFVHSHVLVFDARFVESTWHIVAHLLSYMSGVTDQVVLSCQPLHQCNADLERGDSVSLTLSGSKQSFTAHVYRVSPRMQRRHAVEVFHSPVHGLGVRAVRALRAGQTILRAVGEVTYHTLFAQLPDVSKQAMYPYLTRVPSLDKVGKRAYLHALGLSRYINSHVRTAHAQNVAVRTVNADVLVVAVREIARGEELLSHYDNWTTDGHMPWLADEDLRQ